MIMNNKRIGKIAVTAIVGILSAISGIMGVEMIKSIRKEIESAGDYNGKRSSKKTDKR